MVWLLNLNTSGIKKAFYNGTRITIASCKLQDFLDLLTARFKVIYREIDSMVYFNIVKLLHVQYDKSLTLFERSELNKVVKVLKVS